MVSKDRSVMAEWNRLWAMVHNYDKALDYEVAYTPLWSDLGVRVVESESTDSVYYRLGEQYLVAGGLGRHASWVIARLVSLFADKPSYLKETQILERVTDAGNQYVEMFSSSNRSPLALMTCMLQEAREAIIDYVMQPQKEDSKVSQRFFRKPSRVFALAGDSRSAC